MRDHLIRVASIAAAKTAISGWVRKDENNLDVFRLPAWCDILPVEAYSSMAPLTLASGKWFIVSLDRDVKLPDAAKAAIQAEGERDEGLKLPSGIVGLSTIWAGMKLN